MTVLDYLNKPFSQREYLDRSNIIREKREFKQEELKEELKGEK